MLTLLSSILLTLLPVTSHQISVLQRWQAGATVTNAVIEAYGGTDRCFTAEEIPDSIWSFMQGKSYHPNDIVSHSDLRYLKVLHWDYDGCIHLGEIICNRLIAYRLVSIFRQLYNARYPIQRMVLPDNYDADDERQMRDNNSSCFCYRRIRGRKQLSKHAMGLAVDINTLYNPCVTKRRDGTLFVQPSTAVPYCDRSKTFRYKISPDDLCYRLFIDNGFTWGGSWKQTKDYQHFEFSGQIDKTSHFR